MKVRIEMLAFFGQVKDRLQGDGWEIERQDATGFWIRHASVPSESLARARLNRLGLLTSAAVRIEFGLPRSRVP
jgi:hypothetical protein